MSPKLLEGHSRPIVQNLIASGLWELVRVGVPVLVTWYATHQTSLEPGWTTPWVFLVGSIIFLSLVIAFRLLLGPRSQRSFAAPEPLTPEAQPTDEPCPDTWLHHVANIQREDIEQLVEVTKVDWSAADLFREKPYVQFCFFIRNCSVFHVTLSDPHGNIDYANEPIRGTLRWVKEPREMFPGSSSDDHILRLTIEDKEDIRRILNIESWFCFDNLNIKIQDKHKRAEPRPLRVSYLADVQWLRVKYPKLKMEIIDTQLRDFRDVTAKSDQFEVLGSIVNVRLKFENEGRQIPIEVRSFKLDTNPAIKRITNAQEGKIYEHPITINPNVGLPLDNLNMCPIEVGQYQPFEGWLQFIIVGIKPMQLKGSAPTVIITAESGEQHRIGVPTLRLTQ